MRDFVLIFVVLFSLGCTQPSGGEKKRPQDNLKPVAGETRLEKLAYESFQKRDSIRAKNLRDLKGVRFDAKRQQAIAEAGSKASIESWKPVAEELSKRLDNIPQDDQESFDSVIEEIARASEKASR